MAIAEEGLLAMVKSVLFLFVLFGAIAAQAQWEQIYRNDSLIIEEPPWVKGDTVIFRWGQRVISTTNGGGTWDTLSWPNKNEVGYTLAIYARNSRIRYAIVTDMDSVVSGKPGRLCRTTDGGRTWTVQCRWDTILGRLTLGSIMLSKTNPDVLFTTFHQQPFLYDLFGRSTDGGVTWYSQDAFIAVDTRRDIYLDDNESDSGFVFAFVRAGFNPETALYWSHDYGSTWQYGEAQNSPDAVRKIKSGDRNTGTLFVLRINPSLAPQFISTSDFGSHWDTLIDTTTDTSQFVNVLDFVVSRDSPAVIFAAAKDSGVMFRDPISADWVWLASPDTLRFFLLSWDQQTHTLYAVTNHGISRYRVHTGISTIAAKAPGSDLLRDCFPNPALEQASVSIALSPGRSGELSLIDQSGKTVRKVFVNKPAQGILRVAVDVSGLPNGAYFLCADVGGARSVRKLYVMHRALR
jgi:photosystem II stability/assembly factor-like uncharacterized protein